MSTTEIPQEIKDRIESYIKNVFPEVHKGDQSHKDIITIAEFGYSLSQQERDELRKEVADFREQNARLRRYLEDYDKDYAKKHGIV